MLREDPERDLATLAGRIDGLIAGFTALRSDPPVETVSWVGGTKLAPSVVACHLLEELLVHGYDVSRALRTRWLMDASHSALAILGGAAPIIEASPQSWIRPQRAVRVTARIEVRLRGHGAFAIEVDRGDLHVENPPTDRRANAYLSADPGELLLVMLGRKSRWSAFVTGKAVAWGRRPRALFDVLSSISPP
jgi:hypothetical protein